MNKTKSNEPINILIFNKKDNKMPALLCRTQIINIGQLAKSFSEENMLITFKEGIPSDLFDYCFILPKDLSIAKPLAVNQTIHIGQYSYAITAVGSIATVNFKQLGHITIIFDGEKQAKMDGAIHVKGDYPSNLVINDELTIFENE